MSKNFVDFRVDGETVESTTGLEPPRVGETVEIGARFDEDGERLDAGTAGYDEWTNAEYKTVLAGEVIDVTRHYHNALGRPEMTATVDVEPVDNGDGVPTFEGQAVFKGRMREREETE